MPAARPSNAPSALFWSAVAAALIGALAALSAGDARPSYALASNWVYRVEVGLAVFAALYFLGMALFLAWQGMGFFKVSLGPAGAEAADANRFEVAASEVEALSRRQDDLHEVMRSEVSALDVRLSAVEATIQRGDA